MAVRKRGNGYQADITRGGHRIREMFETEEEANGYVADVEAALANGRPIPVPGAAQHGTRPGSVSLKEIHERTYAKEYAHLDSGWPKIVEKYMQANEAFWGADTAISKCAEQVEVDRIVKSWRDAKNAQSTINSKLAVLSKVFGYALKNRHIKEAPEMDFRRVDNMRLTYLSYDDEAVLLRLAHQLGKDDVEDVIVCLLDTGFRPSELWNFKGTDMGPEEDEGALPLRVTKGKTVAARRRIYATDRVKAVLLRRRSVYGLGKLFPKMSNSKLRVAWETLRDIMKRVDDPDFVPYILRHTCASRLVQKGVHLGVVKNWMGHENIQMTMRYAKHAPADYRMAAGVLNQAPPKPKEETA